MGVMYQLKKKIKEHDNLSNILRYFYMPAVMIKKLVFNIGCYRRRQGKSDSNFSSIQKFRNIHKGKRCFIVATGPSLRIEDLEMIRGEYTFSMNSIYLAYTKTTWRPTYYIIQDPYVYEKIKHELNPGDYEAMFIGSMILEKFPVQKDKNMHAFPLDMLWQQIPRMKYHSKFSEDVYSRVYSGYNVAYSALQIAVYMGFCEIYLLGADCDYLKNGKFFMEDKSRGAEKHFTRKFYETNTPKYILAYTVGKEYADRHGIKIFNSTRGGMLEVYPRVDLEKVVNKDAYTVHSC